MGRLALTYDEGRHLLVAAVMISAKGSSVAPDAAHALPVEMLFDTGSSVSSMSEETAALLGIATDRLDRRMTGGIGGMKTAPVIRGVSVWLVPDSGEAREIQLPEMLLWENTVDERTSRHGPLRQTGTRRMAGVNLLGLDALCVLGGKLTVGGNPLTGQLEW